MGDRHQTPLGFDFPHPADIESAEFPVVLDMPEDRLHLDIAQDAEPLALFGEQVGFDLFPETLQAMADIKAGTVFGLCTFRLERAGVTVWGFVYPDIGLVTIFSFGMMCRAVGQVLLGRAGELPLGIVREVLGTKKGLVDQLGFAMFLLLAVESIV